MTTFFQRAKNPFSLILLIFIPSSSFATPRLITIGDLPGGNIASAARDVSDDGSVVVGVSLSTQGREAFRWTEAGGIIGLGDIPGRSVGSTALGVSGDGNVVVGISDDPDGGLDIQGFELSIGGGSSFDSSGVSFGGSSPFNFPFGSERAFRWTAQSGIAAIGEITGGNQSVGFDVSDNGNIIVGTAERGSRASSIRWIVDSEPRLDAELDSDDIHTTACSGDGLTFVATAFSLQLSPSVIAGIVGRDGDFLQLLSSFPDGPVLLGKCSRDGLFVCGAAATSIVSNQFRTSGALWRISAESFVNPLDEMLPVLSADSLVGVTGNSEIICVADGAVMMVGNAETAVGSRSFVIPGIGRSPIWLEDFLEVQNIEVGNFTIVSLTGVSRDGRTLIGSGINSVGNLEGFLITDLEGVPSPDLLSFEGERSGDTFTVSWNSFATTDYQIESFNDSTQSWEVISSLFDGNGARMSFSIQISSETRLLRLQKQ